MSFVKATLINFGEILITATVGLAVAAPVLAILFLFTRL